MLIKPFTTACICTSPPQAYNSYLRCNWALILRENRQATASKPTLVGSSAIEYKWCKPQCSHLQAVKRQLQPHLEEQEKHAQLRQLLQLCCISEQPASEIFLLEAALCTRQGKAMQASVAVRCRVRGQHPLTQPKQHYCSAVSRRGPSHAVASGPLTTKGSQRLACCTDNSNAS